MTDLTRTLQRVGTFTASPTWRTMSPADQDGFQTRVLALHVEVPDNAWEALSPADRDLIRTGELEVAAGRSESLTDPTEHGDPSAIDAALEADDDDALDAALFAVGNAYGARLSWTTGEPLDEDLGELDADGNEPDDEPAESESKGHLEASDFDWVGL